MLGLQQNVGPDLDPNWLTVLDTLKNFSKKLILKKKSADDILFLFVLILSVKQGPVFLGCTSTK